MRDLSLCGSEAYCTHTDSSVQSVLDPVLLVVTGTDLRPQVGPAVIASQLQRNEVINLIAARAVRFDPVLGIDALLE
jgi:hypothetical protein